MPPIVIGAIMIVAGFAAPTVSIGLVLGGLSMMISGIMSTLGGKKSPSLPSFEQESRGQLVNVQTSQAAIPIVYGTMRTGINRVYINTTGTNNDKLHIVGVLSEGECDSIYNSEVYLGDDLISTYGSDATYTFHNGATDQTYDTTLNGYDSDWTDSLRNTTYLYLRFTFNRDKFSSFPDITTVMKGRKLYDPRTATTVWSNNPALVIWDLMTNGFYGLGWETTDLDSASFQTVATWLETNGYTFNGCIREREAALDLLIKCLDNFRGALIWSGGTWKLMVLKYDASVMTVTDDDIVEGSHKAARLSVQNVINTCRIKYSNAANNYTIEDLIVDDPASITTDGETRESELYLNGTTSYSQAQKIAAYKIDRARLDGVYSFVGRPRLLALEPGDMITITTSPWSWTSQVARVVETVPMANYQVGITLMKETSSLYDDSVNTATHTQYTTSLPNPKSVPPSVINISWEEETYTQGDNTYSRIKISFDPPTDYPFFKTCHVYISWDGGIIYKFLGKNDTGFMVETLREGQTFKLKFLTVSTYDIAQQLADVPASDVAVTGVATNPSDISNFQAICGREDVTFTWDGISDTDLRFYELRLGSAWGSSLILSSTRAVSVSFTKIRPAIHTFLLKAVNTANLYSTNASLYIVTTYAPISYSQSVGSPYNEIYDSGTHYNTTYEDDGTYGRILRVKTNSLTNGNMESWASATDLNSWTETLSGTSTVNREAVTIHAGTYSCRLDVDSNNSPVSIKQTMPLRATALSKLTFYHRETAPTLTLKRTKHSNIASRPYLWNGVLDVKRSAHGNKANMPALLKNNELLMRSAKGGHYANKPTLSDSVTSALAYSIYSDIDAEYLQSNGSWSAVPYWFNVPSASAEWKQVEQPFTTESSGNYTVAFRNGNAASKSIYIDDVVVWSQKGYYVSPTTDLTALVQRRIWLSELVPHYYGSGTTWDSVFASGQLWTDKLSAGKSWIHLFGAANCGTLSITFNHSEDNISYNRVKQFHLYQTESTLRYFNLGFEIENVNDTNYITLEDVNTRIYQV